VTKYCFLTTLDENLTLLYAFTFAYSMLSVINELLISIYKRVQIPLDYAKH
jgi:hypothetical protein